MASQNCGIFSNIHVVFIGLNFIDSQNYYIIQMISYLSK